MARTWNDLINDPEFVAHAKETKKIYDRAEARFSDELGAAIEAAKAQKNARQ